MPGQKDHAELEGTYKQLYESLPIAYFTLSQRGTILQANEAAERLLGCKCADLVRRNFAAFLPKDIVARKTGNMVLSELLQGRRFKDVEMLMRKTDGTNLWVSITAGPLSESKSTSRYGLMVLDINRRKLAEEREDEERSRANLYLEVVTHDLNSVNQSILFALGLLEDGVDLPENLQRTIQEAQWNVRKSARMISNMRCLIQLRDSPPTKEKVDLFPLFSSAVRAVGSDFPWKNLKVSSNIEEGKFILNGHRYIKDIIFNVIHNSAMFDEHSEVKIDIFAESIDDGHVIRLEFADHGPGIPDQLKEFVFKRTGKPDFQMVGRGLGLTYVDAIVESLGGEIWAEDKVDGDHTRGTKFICMLPAWVDEEELPCGKRNCIFFYKSEECFWCDPALEILMGILEEVGVASTSVEIVNVDDPAFRIEKEALPMLPHVKLCDVELSGFMSETEVREAVMKMLMKPCYRSL